MPDYYLKWYVNGGFFSKKNLYMNYKKLKNTDKFDLEEKIFLIWKCTYYPSIKIKISYSIDLYMIKNRRIIMKKQIFLSAFRIIGNMDNKIKYHKDLILPNC